MRTVFVIANIRRATLASRTKEILVVRPASESVIVVRVCQLAGAIWVVDIRVDGCCNDIAVTDGGGHAVLAPWVRAVPGYLAVDCSFVDLCLFGVDPDFAGVVEDREIARPLWMGRVVPDAAVREDHVLVFVVFAGMRGR
jgi:hypothetical protein